MIILEWKDYTRIYQDYEISVHQARLISYLSSEVIKDFPYDMSRYYEISAFPKLRQAAEIVSKILKGFMEGRQPSKEVYETIEKDDSLADLAESLFYLFGLQVKRGALSERMEFQRIQNFQELIIHHSNFDAFLSDSVRAICCKCPDVMKKSRVIQWEEILSCEGWDELMSMLVEMFVRDLGWGQLIKRLDELSKIFKLELRFHKDDVQSITELDVARNLIVHNGGKANQEYVNLKDTNDIEIGDYIPIDNGDLRRFSRTLQLVANDIFVEVSRKYFHKKSEEILSATGRRR